MKEIPQQNHLRSAACASMLAGVVFIASSCKSSGKAEARGLETAEPPTVAVAKATRQDLSHSVKLTAEFRPYQEIDVMAKVSGYVKQIRVDVGDRVRQGELLATLEIPEMADDLARARASVARSNAEVARANDDIRRRNRRTTWRTSPTSGCSR
jgi:multidrug efflux pump subunit AcrA (membrane-fusion protein)